MLGLLGSFLVYATAYYTLSFLFGDADPGWTQAAIKGFALLAFALVFLTTVAAGWRIGVFIDLNPKSDKVKARERALNLFVAAVIVNALFVGALGYYVEKKAQDYIINGPPIETAQDGTPGQGGAGQEPASALERSLHDITGIDATDPGVQSRFIPVSVTLNGTRHGNYRLEIDLTERVHNAMLLRQHKSFLVAPGQHSIRMTLDRDEIAKVYEEKILGNRPEGQQMDIIGDFRLNIRLIPELSNEEANSLPDYAANSISLGTSKLIRSRETSLRLALKFQ